MTTMKTLQWVLTFSAAYAAVCIGDDSSYMDVDTVNLLSTHKVTHNLFFQRSVSERNCGEC